MAEPESAKFLSVVVRPRSVPPYFKPYFSSFFAFLRPSSFVPVRHDPAILVGLELGPR